MGDFGLLIAISGRARMGKDTLADFLREEFNKELLSESMWQKGNGMVKVAYADALKERIMEDFNLSWAQVYGDLKEVEDKRYPRPSRGGISPAAVRYDSHDRRAAKLPPYYWTPREIMQFMGTDCYRAIDDNFWVKQLFKTLSKRGIKNAIISDCRFVSEVEAVLNRGGCHIRIYREGVDTIHGSAHTSETSLDDYKKIDFAIENSGTLEDLKLKANKLAKIIMEDFNNGS